MRVLDTQRRTGTIQLVSSRVRAGFDPARGMLGTSLELDGEELLGPLGIPFLHPWANRLSRRLPGADVPRDDAGLPIHGTHPRAGTVQARGRDTLVVSLDYADELFPFPHLVVHFVRLRPTALRIDTAVRPSGNATVPVAFGFHPYFALRPGDQLVLPARRRLVTDDRLIPTGGLVDEPAEAGPVRPFDDGYEVDEGARFAIRDRLEVAFLGGYRYAQIFAPPGKGVVCFEPMTAPTDALTSGFGLRHVGPGATFRASFEVRV